MEYKATQAQIGGDLRTALVVNDVERKIAAEQHASGSGGFNGDWSKAFTYVIGGLQIGGAAAEMNLGATLLTTSAVMASTGVGIPAAFLTGALGLFLVCHGLDHANAGFQLIVTGAPQRTLTSQALDSLTGSEFYSDIIDGALGMAAGAAGAKILRLATMTDDMGRCMNMFSRAHYGGCFTGNTLVHVTAVVDGEPSREPSREHDEHRSSTTATATATQCLAISKVPIGARVLAENPRPEEFDDSFAEPVQSEWARVSFLIVRNDLSVVEAEFIRPREWIESLGLVKGARIDLAVPELGIDGLAEVTAVRNCPPIADGEGRVVTGRFVTRDVANVVRITLANGTEIRATDVHPVWSVDREDWVPAGKLEPGEHVDTLSGPVAVASVEPLDRHPAVYNLEVHGEHVYRIAVDGVLVHNAGPGTYVASALLNGVRNLPDELGLSPVIQRAILRAALKAEGTGLVAHHLIPLESLAKFRDLMTRAARGGFDINGAGNGALLTQWVEHSGSHPGYNSAVMDHLGRLAQLVKQRRLGDAAVAELMQDTARILAEAIRNGSFMPMF